METRTARSTRGACAHANDVEAGAANDGPAPAATAGAGCCGGAAAHPAAAADLLAHFTLLLAQEGHLVGDAVDEAAARRLVGTLWPRLPPALLRACAPAGPGAATATAAAAAEGQPGVAQLPAGTATTFGAAGGPASAAAPGAEAAQPAAPEGGASAAVQLRLHHSCRSTACGDLACTLCRYNTVQPCGRSLTSRYLAEDPLRAPCGAPVHVAVGAAEAPAGDGACQPPPNPLLKSGTAIEVIVINGDVYDGLAPAPGSCGGAPAPPPLADVLAACAIDRAAARGPLLRAEAGVAVLGAGGSTGGASALWRSRSRGSGGGRALASGASSEAEDDEGASTEGGGEPGGGPAPSAAAGAAPAGAHDRLVLLPQGGLVSLSGLRCIASSEAVLQAKGGRFRLALRAVDARTGEPLPGIGHAISEPFLVATRRMKGALKRDTPTTSDDIARLVHIGRATAEKLRRLAAAARAEGIGLRLPASGELDRVETVGQFAALAALAAGDAATRAALLGLLRLSSAHWGEAVAHAGAAVPPDGRRRLFAAQSPAGHVGLLFEARLGALLADEGPCGVVLPSGTELPLRALDARLTPLLPTMRDQAMRQWRLPGHPGWGIYARDEPTLGRAASSGEGTAKAGAAGASRQSSGRTSPVEWEQQQRGATMLAAALASPRVDAAAAPAQAQPALIAHQASLPVQPPCAPATAPGAHADDALKRARSETAERRAGAMADARARLLALRRSLPAAAAEAAPAGADAPAPWDVDPTEGADVDTTALMTMYRRWQEGSLTLPAGAGAGAGAGADAAAAPTTEAAVAAGPFGAVAAAGLTFMPLGSVAPRERSLLLPTDVEALLGDADPEGSAAAAAPGAAARPALHSAPLMVPRSAADTAAARQALLQSLSEPGGFARPLPSGGPLPGSLEGAPWLVGGELCGRGGCAGSLDDADILCSGLREMSFDLPRAIPH